MSQDNGLSAADLVPKKGGSRITEDSAREEKTV